MLFDMSLTIISERSILLGLTVSIGMNRRLFEHFVILCKVLCYANLSSEKMDAS